MKRYISAGCVTRLRADAGRAFLSPCVCRADGQFDGRSVSLRGRTVLDSGRLGSSSAGQLAEGLYKCGSGSQLCPTIFGTEVGRSRQIK